MGDYEIRIDTKKNRAVLRLSGFFTDDEIKELVKEVGDQGLIDQLKPGFDVINDIRTFKPASPKGAKELFGIQSQIKEIGVGRIIRIVGSDVLGKKQFDRNSKQAGYKAAVASSIEEAEKMLDAGMEE